MLRFVLALIVIVMPAGGLSAQPLCSGKDTILTLSNLVPEGRGALPRLASRNYGAEAAYLKIRYGELSADETDALLKNLRDGGVREADQMALAWTISRHGYEAAKQAFDAKTLDLALTSGGISALRAMLLSDGGDEIVATLIAALPKQRQPVAVSAAITAVIDQPDEFKSRVIAAAERHEVWLLAATFAAAETDPAVFKAFAERQEKRGGLQDLISLTHWVPAYVGNPGLQREPAQTPEIEAARIKIQQVMITAALEPERDFLMTFLNQTGLVDETASVAADLRDRITDGSIRRNGGLDEAWLFAYRALLKATGKRDMVDSQLTAVPFSTGRYLRMPAGLSVRDAIDRLIAVEALTSYVQGATDAPPGLPGELSKTMAGDWDNWSGVAQMVRGNTTPSPGLAADPGLLAIAGELLVAKGSGQELTDFLARAPAGEPLMALANDYAKRLDRKCASYLAHPAEALLLAGQPIFKFDPPK